MNAWVLSLIMCAATPQADGSYCEALALRYAMSREQCRSEVATWGPRLAHLRLECTEDPALSAGLEEMEREDQDEGRHDAGVVDPTLLADGSIFAATCTADDCLVRELALCRRPW